MVPMGKTVRALQLEFLAHASLWSFFSPLLKVDRCVFTYFIIISVWAGLRQWCCGVFSMLFLPRIHVSIYRMLICIFCILNRRWHFADLKQMPSFSSLAWSSFSAYLINWPCWIFGVSWHCFTIVICECTIKKLCMQQ